MTLTELINKCKRYTPKATTISTSDLLADISDIQTALFIKINRINNEFEISSEISTVSGELNYLLPDYCEIDNIIKMQLSCNTNPQSEDEWEEVLWAGLNDDIDITKNYYSRTSEDSFLLLKQGEVVTESNLLIKIYFYPKPSVIDNIDDVLELEEQYHNLILWDLCQRIASQGSNPDIEVANYYQQKYDEDFKFIRDNINARLNKSPNTKRQFKGRW